MNNAQALALLEPTDQDMEYSNIRKWMLAHKNEYRDPRTNEINCTTLAEECALELYPGEWLPETHEVWDVAVDIENEDEIERKAVLP